MLADLGMLSLRLVTGSLLAGHGSQKLFGSFGGAGVKGTAGWLESIGFRPGQPWAVLAGAAEFGGGVLTALGLFHPLGPITVMAPMSMALFKVHWGKPIWAAAGGGELPLTNMAAATALTCAGPGRLTMDELLDIRLPKWMVALSVVGTAAGIALGAATAKPSPQAESKAGAELEGGR